MGRLPNLNILRFFLAMIVMLGHIGATSKNLGLPHFPDAPIRLKTNLAVYFFFTLSGFLIIRQLYLESLKGRLNIKYFYIRRMLRILPLYFIILFAGVSIYFVLLPLMGIQTGFENDLAELLKYFLLFLPNVYISVHPQDVGGILFILWSIGIELQFYLFIPLVVMAFPKHIIRSLLVLILLHIVSSALYPAIAGHYFNYYYFLTGGIVSILSIKVKLRFMGRIEIKILLILLFLVLFFTKFPVIRNDIVYYLVSAAIAALFICSISDYPIGVLKSKSLNYLGEISYGLYMYHMISITAILFLFSRLQLADKINNNFISAIIINLGVIASTIVIAHFSYQHIELFFIKKKSMFTSRTDKH
jgi:peptidoglycan/LPS O-acetylase OafA/YrhL